MYEPELTHQALCTTKYRNLIGTELDVFSGNVGLIIEIIRMLDPSESWYELIDKEAGKLHRRLLLLLDSEIPGVLANKALLEQVVDLFARAIKQRNRIFHGFRVTGKNGDQVLATKEKGAFTYDEITEADLKKSITHNDVLSRKLHDLRKVLRQQADTGE